MQPFCTNFPLPFRFPCTKSPSQTEPSLQLTFPRPSGKFAFQDPSQRQPSEPIYTPKPQAYPLTKSPSQIVPSLFTYLPFPWHRLFSKKPYWMSPLLYLNSPRPLGMSSDTLPIQLAFMKRIISSDFRPQLLNCQMELQLMLLWNLCLFMPSRHFCHFQEQGVWECTLFSRGVKKSDVMDSDLLCRLGLWVLDNSMKTLLSRSTFLVQLLWEFILVVFQFYLQKSVGT